MVKHNGLFEIIIQFPIITEVFAFTYFIFCYGPTKMLITRGESIMLHKILEKQERKT